MKLIRAIAVVLAAGFVASVAAQAPAATKAARLTDAGQAALTAQMNGAVKLGYAPAKNRSGATQERVGIPLASRLTLALGRDPHELEGC